MKIMFLHISDLHIQGCTKISITKIKKMVNSLNSFDEIDKIFVVCSGDLANAGNKKDYQSVDYFFRQLLRELKKRFSNYIEFCIVPGNHDIKINQENMIPETTLQNLYIEYEKMVDFFEFAEQNKKFITMTTAKKDVNSIVRNLGGEKKICINLINSAPFSSLKHDDKDNHYINPNNIVNIKSDADLNIVIMHHSHEWFHEDIRLVLKEKILSNDILFYGHEHSQNFFVEEYGNNGLITSKAGAFDPDDYNNNSFFNVLIYDSDINCVDIFEYSWNKKSQMFIRDSQDIKRKLHRFEKFKYSNDFTEELLKDEKCCISQNFTDYYAFPDLRKEGENGDEKICNLEVLKKIIIANKVLSISGKNDSGRTSLLKYMYLNIRKTKFSLYLTAEEMNNKKIKKIIKFALNTQIDDRHPEDKYDQLLSSDRVVFIDNFDRISNELRFELLKYLHTEFSNIIITSSDDTFVKLKDEFKDKLEFDVQNVKLNRITRKQRKEIVKNLSELHNVDYDKNMVFQIDRSIQNTPLLSMLGNTFTLNYINMTVLNGNLFSGLGKDSFSILFEQTLRRVFIECVDNDQIESYLKVLELLAYDVHLNKQELFCIELISNVISKYNENYGKKISINKFINTMTKSHIFKEVTINNFAFINKMYLAYFVAKNINFEMINNDNYSGLHYIIKNICFGINDDILLFLVYISKNMKLIKHIYNNTMNVCKDWNEFSFDERNVPLIYEIEKITNKIEKINDEDISSLQEMQIDEEVKHFENYNITCEGIYDYNEDDVKNEIKQLECLQKLIELLARGLYSFNANMVLSQQKEIVEAIYTCTNKFLYKVLIKFDQDFDDLIEYFKESSKEISVKKWRIIIINFLIFFIYGIYNKNISLCTSSQSYTVIEDYLNLDQNLNNKKLFKLIVLDNTNKNEKFNECLFEILDKVNDGCILYIIKILLINRFITRDFNSSERSRLIDKYNNMAKRDYLISKKNINMKRLQNASNI